MLITVWGKQSACQSEMCDWLTHWSVTTGNTCGKSRGTSFNQSGICVVFLPEMEAAWKLLCLQFFFFFFPHHSPMIKITDWLSAAAALATNVHPPLMIITGLQWWNVWGEKKEKKRGHFITRSLFVWRDICCMHKSAALIPPSPLCRGVKRDVQITTGAIFPHVPARGVSCQGHPHSFF